LQATVGSQTSVDLSGFGLELLERFKIDLFLSGAGGQGSGLVILLLALISRRIQKARQLYKVNVHLLLPGFHSTQNDFERADQCTRALSVWRDLAALKVRGRPLEIPFPGGNIELEARHTREIFDYLFIYQPTQTENALYHCFVNRVSNTIIDSELSAFSNKLRSTRSQSNDLARRGNLRTHLMAVGE